MQWPKGWEVSYRPNFAGIIGGFSQPKWDAQSKAIVEGFFQDVKYMLWIYEKFGGGAVVCTV